MCVSWGAASRSLQPPLFLNGLPNSYSMVPASPTRFLGWKYAEQAGGDYLKAFSRSRAQASLPTPVADLSQVAGTSAGSAPTPALAGLQLRSLLPADFIPTAVAAGDLN